MPSRPHVSVIVLVLNNAHGISVCVGALLRQTYPDRQDEIVVADNGSTDSLMLRNLDAWLAVMDCLGQAARDRVDARLTAAAHRWSPQG